MVGGVLQRSFWCVGQLWGLRGLQIVLPFRSQNRVAAVLLTLGDFDYFTDLVSSAQIVLWLQPCSLSTTLTTSLTLPPLFFIGFTKTPLGAGLQGTRCAHK